MTRSSHHVAVANFSQTYPRFEFDGLRKPEYCHLKVDVREGVPVFLLSRLVNYAGRSIDEASTAIKRKIIATLYHEGVLVPSRRRTLLARCFPHSFDERQRRDIVQFIDQCTIWVGCCSGFLDEEGGPQRYEFIDFRRVSSTSVTLEELVKATGLDSSFFDVPRVELLFSQELR
ncbi:MAG TPA: hypothetical protein VL424_03735 [Pararobbsia sp.]|jgi:hypothetical protein|nr:hypothetical protein [Pararobbsia sp.]